MDPAPAPSKIRLLFISCDGTVLGPVEFLKTDSILSVQLVLRDMKGAEYKLPQLTWNEGILRSSETIMSCKLTDMAELSIVWPAGAFKAPPDMPHFDFQWSVDLEMALTRAESLHRVLNLSGCSVPGPFWNRMPTNLLELDIRKCYFDPTAITNVFRSIPPTVAVLRASHNGIPPSALHCLAKTGCLLRVLDVGFSDWDDEEDDELEAGDFALDYLKPFLNEGLEELGLGDLGIHFEVLCELGLSCSHLKKLEVGDCPRESWGQLDDAEIQKAWEAFSKTCTLLEELDLGRVGDDSAVLAIVSGCPKLKVLKSKVEVSSETLTIMANSNLQLESISLTVDSVDALSVASKLPNVSWLHIKADTCETELDGPFLEKVDDAIGGIVASDVELALPAFSRAALIGIGSRLRSVCIQNEGDSPPLLPILASVCWCCPNLMQFQVGYYEQICSEDIKIVAENCPLLEVVCLNADESGFQKHPIDDGVLALKSCCKLRHLDLYDRCMLEPARTLALACEGWPKLEYLCAAGTHLDNDDDNDDGDDDVGPKDNSCEWMSSSKNDCLPRALSTYCPLLTQLVLYPVPVEWCAILMKGCPLYPSESRAQIFEALVKVSRKTSIQACVEDISLLLRRSRKVRVKISSRGSAIPSAVKVAACLEKGGIGNVSKLRTDIVDCGARQVSQIAITMQANAGQSMKTEEAEVKTG